MPSPTPRMHLSLAACVLLLSAWAVVADDSHLGGECTGDLLLDQSASTDADTEPYIVAYGGDPDVEISCITTQDFSATNTTLSTLVAGGPGRRFAILRVTSTDDSDADFAVKVFGSKRLSIRKKRQDGTSTTTTEKPKSKNPIIAAADNIGKIAKTVRILADQLDAVQKLIVIIGTPLSQFTGARR